MGRFEAQPEDPADEFAGRVPEVYYSHLSEFAVMLSVLLPLSPQVREELPHPRHGQRPHRSERQITAAPRTAAPPVTPTDTPQAESPGKPPGIPSETSPGRPEGCPQEGVLGNVFQDALVDRGRQESQIKTATKFVFRNTARASTSKVVHGNSGRGLYESAEAMARRLRGATDQLPTAQ